MSIYENWTVFRLKKELAERGAITRGRKRDLIDRLEAYARNSDFRGPLIPIPDVVLTDWPKFGFHQLTGQDRDSFPTISDEDIECYFSFRLATSILIVPDCQAISKGKLLVESGRIHACSVLMTVSAVFISGIVKAAMKKKVAYNVRLKIEHTGEIINSDCECPAGKGPHGTCKHLAAMLSMLLQFRAAGNIAIQKSCTDSLQTFHHPKQTYDGSPVKMRNLTGGRKLACVDGADDDPRPMKYRHWPGFDSHVANAVCNYVAVSNKDIAFRYLLPAADIQTASLDHDYLPIPFTEYWIDKAIQVESCAVVQIEKDTRGQSKSQQWYVERQWRLTASRFGDVCKATEKRNMLKLCEAIKSAGRLKTQAVLHGRKYEKVAISRFCDITGMTVEQCGLFVCKEYPYLAASPDGVIVPDHTVEVKCPFRGKGKAIEPGEDFPFLLRDSSTGLMHLKTDSTYYYQVQGQLAISKRRSCFFIVYTIKELFYEEIFFDEEFWQLNMRSKLENFFKKYLRPYLAKQL